MRAIWDRAHHAERARPAMISEEWRLLQDRMNGTYRVHRLGNDVREAVALGPLLYEQGVRGGVRWQQNRNGITYTMTGIHEARDAESERAWDATTDAHVHLIGESVPLNAYVVEINPPSGRHEWRFIDKRTGNLVRRDTIERHRRFITTYDDFRTTEAGPEPSHVRTIDTYGNDRERWLMSRTVDVTPDPREVDIPPSRRDVVEFPSGTNLVRLPLRFINGLPVVRVVVAGRSYDFLLDSGAAGIVIDPAIVEEAKLERYGSRVGATIGTFSESTTIVPSMSVGSLHMHAVVARVLGVPFRADEHTRIFGLLGFDFFAETVVHLDIDHAIAEAILPGAFHAPSDAVSVPLALDDKTAVVRAKADTTWGRITADTGANRSIFTTAFAARADFGSESTAARFRGIGGNGLAEALRIKEFELAGMPVMDPLIDVTQADLGTELIDGTIGTDVLRGYDLFFDYRANVLHVRHVRRS